MGLKKILVFLLFLLLFLAVAVGGVFVGRSLLLSQEQALESKEVEVGETEVPESLAVRAVVEEFGERLKSVPLQAPEEQLRVSIIKEYADYISPELLSVWVLDPSLAPGRLVSSPWPERIETEQVQKREDGTYLVTGRVIELTSVERTAGGTAAKVPIALELAQENGRWVITSVSFNQSVLFDVPFSPQAPFANWLDPRQNYGCEETSAFMAIKWARGETLTLQEAEQVIIDAADWQLENYGEFHDTSAQDTVERIFKGYFGYHNVELRSDITAADMKQALRGGNIVIVPVQGQLLGNPYYTPPGPAIHMIVVVGYDAENREFITNDPGTKRGKQLRYPEAVLEQAVRDYVSGFNEPVTDAEKVMIVVSPDDEVLSRTI